MLYQTLFGKDNGPRMGSFTAIYGKDKNSSTIRRPVYSYIFKEEDLDNEDVIAEIDVRHTYKSTRDEVKRIREKEAATTAPSPLEDGGFIINQP